MSKTTSLVAKQCRLKEWTSQIQECKQRPKGMTVEQWCDQNGVTRDNYYYHLTAVRKACLDNLLVEKTKHVEKIEKVEQSIVPVNFAQEETSENNLASMIELEINGITIKVNESTSTKLLRMVLQVSIGVK